MSVSCKLCGLDRRALRHNNKASVNFHDFAESSKDTQGADEPPTRTLLQQARAHLANSRSECDGSEHAALYPLSCAIEALLMHFEQCEGDGRELAAALIEVLTPHDGGPASPVSTTQEGDGR